MDGNINRSNIPGARPISPSTPSIDTNKPSSTPTTSTSGFTVAPKADSIHTAAKAVNVPPQTGQAPSTGVSDRKVDSSKKSSESSKSEGSGEKEGTSKDEKDTKKAKESGHRRIEKVQSIKQMNQMHKHRGFEAFLKRMGEFKTLQEYIFAAKNYYNDVTLAHAGLQYAREALRKQKKYTKLADGLDEATELFYSEEGPAIRAGLNIDAPKEEVDLFRTHVLGFTSASQAFKSIMEKNGRESFNWTLESLIRSIGQDQQAMDPAIDKLHLHDILNGIYLVQSCSTLEKECSELIEQMTHNYHAEPQIDSIHMTSEMLEIMEMGGADPARYDKIADQVQLPDKSAKADFAQRFRVSLLSIPEKLLVKENRERLSETLKDWVDDVITEEEHELAAKDAEEREQLLDEFDFFKDPDLNQSGDDEPEEGKPS